MLPVSVGLATATLPHGCHGHSHTAILSLSLRVAHRHSPGLLLLPPYTQTQKLYQQSKIFGVERQLAEIYKDAFLVCICLFRLLVSGESLQSWSNVDELTRRPPDRAGAAPVLSEPEDEPEAAMAASVSAH